jgi:ABC-type transporter Mla MlaB component
MTKPRKRKRAVSVAAPVIPAVVEAAIAVTEPEVAAAVEPVVSDEGTVTLSSNASLRDAGALKDALVRVLDRQATVTLDARAVERVDTATLQLLAAFVRDRQMMSRQCVWHAAPAALIEAARLLGFTAALGLSAHSGVAA